MAGTLPFAVDTVLMASGQGSQKPGMGADLLDVPEVAATFALASGVLGRDVAALCTGGEGLDDTRNAQAAIATLSIAIGRALEARGVRPDALLGFSLGQVSALALGGMVSDADALRIVRERSRIMGEVADANPGVMSAFLKGSPADVEAVCAECAQGDVLVAANYNSPAQTVVAGTPAAVERAEAAWKERGGRASRLATSGAFHSPLMADACEPFAAFLEGVGFSEPAVPIIGNADAAPLSAANVRQKLVEHLVSPVRFTESVELLTAAGATTFAEVGFGGVLSGLVKRCAPDAARPCIQDKASLEEFAASRA